MASPQFILIVFILTMGRDYGQGGVSPAPYPMLPAFSSALVWLVVTTELCIGRVYKARDIKSPINCPKLSAFRLGKAINKPDTELRRFIIISKVRMQHFSLQIISEGTTVSTTCNFASCVSSQLKHRFMKCLSFITDMLTRCHQMYQAHL